ncbi:MAG: trypsin-like peptidase domain-containing protein [Patescibacteria group bacterium]
MENLNSKPKNTGLIISVVIISLLIGGAAGAVFGLLGSQVVPWLNEEQDAEDLLQKSITRELENESATIAAIEEVAPSVVSIIASKEFDDFYYYTESESGLEEIGGGTGVIISKDGHIITNRHVVEDEEAEYSVVFSDGTRHDNVQVLSRDPFNDIAILKLNDVPDLQVAKLADSDALEIGQTVLAIGNVLAEYQNSATKGIISGLGRSIVAGDYYNEEQLDKLIQTDAPINPGNSGGPLINLKGEVVGINVAVDWSGQSIGFAIPINTAKSAIESVKINGKIVRPMLGVRYIPIDKEIAKENNLANDYGVLIIRDDSPGQLAVIPGSPADKAGLEENDIILEIDGEKIDEDNKLPNLIQKYQVGDEVKLKIVHNGEEKEIKATLTEMTE